MTPIPCSQLARERNWHRTTAYRWLRKLHDERGKDYAWQLPSGEWCTSRGVLHKLANESRENLIARLEPRVAALESALQNEKREREALSAQLAEFRRVSHAWMTRHEKTRMR